MLQTISGLFQIFRLPIMIVVGMAGIACSLSSAYLKTSVSVAYYNKLTHFLDIASLVFMVINLILLCMFVWDVFRDIFQHMFQIGF